MGHILGKTIKGRRLRDGATQEEMERRTGLDQGYFSRIENGRIKRPSVEVIAKISRALNCSVSELLRESGIESGRRRPVAA